VYICMYVHICMYLCTNTCMCFVWFLQEICIISPHKIQWFFCNVQALYSVCSRNWSLQIVRGCRDTQIYHNKYFEVFFPSLTHLFIIKYFLQRRKSISKLNEYCHLKKWRPFLSAPAGSGGSSVSRKCICK